MFMYFVQTMIISILATKLVCKYIFKIADISSFSMCLTKNKLIYHMARNTGAQGMQLHLAVGKINGTSKEFILPKFNTFIKTFTCLHLLKCMFLNRTSFMINYFNKDVSWPCLWRFNYKVKLDELRHMVINHSVECSVNPKIDSLIRTLQWLFYTLLANNTVYFINLFLYQIIHNYYDLWPKEWLGTKT